MKKYIILAVLFTGIVVVLVLVLPKSKLSPEENSSQDSSANLGLEEEEIESNFNQSVVDLELSPQDMAEIDVDSVNIDAVAVGTVEPEVLLTTVAENLLVPWSVVFLPSGEILISERSGNIRLVDKAGVLQANPIFEIQEAIEYGEGGLLGLALHPNFIENGFIYAYYTYKPDSNYYNKVVRYRYQNGNFDFSKVIIDKIPAAFYHDGGRMIFGPNGYLFITTGDAQNSNLAQDKDSLAGKILRLSDDGGIAPGNPFASAVYSYGHRNPQGLAFDSYGRLWSTEHGRSGVLSGLDELNLIKIGANYGWPTIEGDKSHSGMENPVAHSGEDYTWAPSAALYYRGYIIFTGLGGEALYVANVETNETVRVTEFFKEEFGRVREVALGPDNNIYILTNNTDGRGRLRTGDDKLIKINSNLFLQQINERYY